MKTVLTIAQIVCSLLLIVAIALQGKGGGLSSVLGGRASVYQTKRGVEKLLFRLTIVLVVLFIVLSILGVAVA